MTEKTARAVHAILREIVRAQQARNWPAVDAATKQARELMAGLQ